MLARLEDHSPGILPLHTDDEAAVVVVASDAECNVNDYIFPKGFKRSAAIASAAPGISVGFRLTSRIASLRGVISLTRSLPIAPPAPRMVNTVPLLARLILVRL